MAFFGEYAGEHERRGAMGQEKRRSLRRQVERRAWIDASDGAMLEECTIGNMSETGAKLVLRAAKEFPDQFVLRLSFDGRVARKCRLAWQSGNAIGVQFIARLVSAPFDVPTAVES